MWSKIIKWGWHGSQRGFLIYLWQLGSLWALPSHLQAGWVYSEAVFRVSPGKDPFSSQARFLSLPEEEGDLGLVTDPCQRRGGKALTQEWRGRILPNIYFCFSIPAWSLLQLLGISQALWPCRQLGCTYHSRQVPGELQQGRSETVRDNPPAPSAPEPQTSSLCLLPVSSSPQAVMCHSPALKWTPPWQHSNNWGCQQNCDPANQDKQTINLQLILQGLYFIPLPPKIRKPLYVAKERDEGRKGQ